MFEMFDVKKKIVQEYERNTGKKCLKAKQVNSGFYGYVFLLQCQGTPEKAIAKVFKKEGYMDLEESQLNLLRNYAIVKVPEVYGKSYASQNGSKDILFMEYINGVTASAVKTTDSLEKERFCNQVVDNLLAIHQAPAPNGFGGLTDSRLSSSWENFYKKEIDRLYGELKSRKIKGFSSSSMDLADTLYSEFDKVFCQPVEHSTLIHGDYNLWNLMADPNTHQLVGMIDPMGCSYADMELDLFQLENANGKDYGLLDCYAKQVKLSQNIALKNEYYHFWDDIKHLVNVGYCDNKLFAKIGNKAIEHLR